MKKQIIFITGPTAVGKTETAVKLAAKINAEIISCDSMQVYQGMDILTSKPAKSLRKKICHYLLGMVSPCKEYNVSRYRRDAILKVKQIIKKGKTPLFIGGTGLYISILADGIFKIKPLPKSIRDELYKEAEKYGSVYLYKQLKKIDPQAAAKIHPNDAKRIIRALEVFKATGKPISVLQKQRSGLADEYDLKIFCLNLERQKLNKRIEQRVEKMFRRGLVREVNKLTKLKLSKTAGYAIGIKEVKGYLEGLYDLDAAKSMMARNTQLYAKRQLTWFRKDKRIEWIEIKEKDSPLTIAERIFKKLQSI
ncbi:MAG: tRNA (adenosine(37)-N6)-dimethylallyltransferase MiaA [Candidatus Omnitrophica bacterium]|jgi:tRNA dimethylallyltransferase|nr:tRNA (adenosine(37)-N6)-dimethylallyltransferase MiaA [Candidatus Omnitrophota bacterium]